MSVMRVCAKKILWVWTLFSGIKTLFIARICIAADHQSESGLLIKACFDYKQSIAMDYCYVRQKCSIPSKEFFLRTVEPPFLRYPRFYNNSNET